MAGSQRTTVYLEQDLHRALRLQAAETRTSVSALINDALRGCPWPQPGPASWKALQGPVT